MKIRLAIIFGILIWVITYIISNILNPLFVGNAPYVNMLIPIVIIVVTGFFGILYIRNITENEVIEGIAVGMVFSIIDIICDYILINIFHQNSLFIGTYPLHMILMIILTLLITTFLGYLAQMKIDLK